MFGYRGLTISDDGILEISGVRCDYLVEKYGTPLYVFNEEEILNRIKEIKENHIVKYGGVAAYASKAFLTKYMCRLIKREGLWLDVVSGGELYTAKSVDFPMENIIFHGNNKTYEELEMAVDFGVGRVVIDNFDEIDILEDILLKKKRSIDVQIRITPGIDGHTHDFIKTGQVDSKFGFPMHDESALHAVKRILNSPALKLKGIHAHIGSQLHQNNIYKLEVEVLAKFISSIKNLFDYEIEEINCGGGFGIYYTEGDKRLSISYFTDVIHKAVEECFSRYNLRKPTVFIEPGRWIVGEAGITLYRVGSIKDIRGIRKYVSVDGGMTDNIRTALYSAKYTAVPANKLNNKDEEQVTICGKCCESGDILIKDIKLPKLERGDIIAVLSTGAYNFSMASNYNRIPRPAVVMVNRGQDVLIVKRETYEDIIKNDL
ncbi:diaminopimelate decarboxylase [Thermobrachium celere]|uniref:Diaminopimelate decarboxylase n=1 Tax=Thermobrachium celere DSM 8682 TaxID=941824 RepID=R7RV46_9CLOT|nr:diaminopimelate decarboxylase [Thermobrachium celere]CDF59405.1 Diaminopimelate decarboxylase [Thermobrachium celere DSM 8682]